MFFSEESIKAGLFLDTAIHDTAQVTSATLIYSQMYDIKKVVDVATVTKLTRNLFIIAVIPFISYLFFKGSNKNSKIIPKWYKLIPFFAIEFLLLSFVRTLGDVTLTNLGQTFGILQESTWQYFYNTCSSLGSKYVLGLAMAGVGLSTDFNMFKGLGMKTLLHWVDRGGFHWHSKSDAHIFIR